MNTQAIKTLSDVLSNFPTPEECDELGLYDDVVRIDKNGSVIVTSYKGEGLEEYSSIEEYNEHKRITDELNLLKERFYAGEMTESQYDRLAEEIYDSFKF